MNPYRPKLVYDCEPLEPRRLLSSVGTLYSTDFSEAVPWPTMYARTFGSGTAVAMRGAYGTIDVEGGTTPSNAVRLAATPVANEVWTSALDSGRLAITNTETNLGKLTLSFSLSVNQAYPVTVSVFSYDGIRGVSTGGLTTTIIPAATNYNQRYDVDLSSMKPSGSGTFNPASAYIAFDFQVGSQNGWSSSQPAQVSIDDIDYAKPAYYVSASGSDANNGRTEATAFANPSKAVSIAQPGDIIDVMNGTYAVTAGGLNSITFSQGGTPAAWVTLKNYPGQSPVITNEWWNAIKIGNGAPGYPATTPAVAYVEVRGMHLIGDSAKVGPLTAPDGPYDASQPAGTYGVYGQYAGLSDPRSNASGINVDSSYDLHKPHDIRIADNIVEQMPGGGIGAGDSDRIQIENNIVKNNCYWDIYASSGISILSKYNFDGTSNIYGRLVRNNISSGNIHKEMWVSEGRYSDGNGIIIDFNHTTTDQVAAGETYQGYNGRTLVTNNVTFNNGGSGIHSYGSYHVDIVNNVAYLNSASTHQEYGEIFAGDNYLPDSAYDVNILNNILVAPVAAAGAAAEPVSGGMTPTSANKIVYQSNVYFGGNIPAFSANAYNIGNVTADPKFVAASIDAAVANFRLQSGSPAINLGVASAVAPHYDITYAPRTGNPDDGAYEYVPSAATALALAAVSDTGTVGDNKTRLNNSSAASKLSFVVSGTISGATVSLYSAGVLLGSATATRSTTTVTTNGTATLPDGTATITAVQTFAGVTSTASPALAITIDTTSPILLATPVINAGTTETASRSQVRTISWTFSKPVKVGLADFVLTNRDNNKQVSLASRSVSTAGNTVTLTLDKYGVDSGPGLFLHNANYELTLSPKVADAAGNTLDASGDKKSVPTPRLDFYKLLGTFGSTRQVTMKDYAVWKTAFHHSTGESGFDPAFDLNADGVVNFSDYWIWRSQLNKTLVSRADGLFY